MCCPVLVSGKQSGIGRRYGRVAALVPGPADVTMRARCVRCVITRHQSMVTLIYGQHFYAADNIG